MLSLFIFRPWEFTAHTRLGSEYPCTWYWYWCHSSPVLEDARSVSHGVRSQTQHLHRAPAQTRDKVSLFKKNHLTASRMTKHELNTHLFSDRSSARSVRWLLFFRLALCHLQMLWLDVRSDDITLTCNCGHTRMSSDISVLAFCLHTNSVLSHKQRCFCFFSKLLSKMRFKEKLQLLYICVDVKNRAFEVHSVVTAQFTHACPLSLLHTACFSDFCLDSN